MQSFLLFHQGSFDNVADRKSVGDHQQRSVVGDVVVAAVVVEQRSCGGAMTGTGGSGAVPY